MRRYPPCATHNCFLNPNKLHRKRNQGWDLCEPDSRT